MLTRVLQKPRAAATGVVLMVTKLANKLGSDICCTHPPIWGCTVESFSFFHEVTSSVFMPALSPLVFEKVINSVH